MRWAATWTTATCRRCAASCAMPRATDYRFAVHRAGHRGQRCVPHARRRARQATADHRALAGRRTIAMFLTKKHLSRRTRAAGRRRRHRAAAARCDDPGAHGAGADRRRSEAARSASCTSRTAPCSSSGRRRAPAGISSSRHILKPLEPLRDYVTVVTGLRNKGAENARSAARHHRSCPGSPARTAQAAVPAARPASRSTRSPRRQIGQDTPLPSLEMCAEPGGYSSLSYRTPVQQLADGKQSAQGVLHDVRPGRQQRRAPRRSCRPPAACSTTCSDASRSLKSKLGAADRALVSDYLESVREVERRVQKLKAKADSLGDLPDAPLGAPDDFTELLDVQFELMALAWQTDQTRIATLRMVNEVSMRRLQLAGRGRGLPPAVAPRRGSGEACRACCACRSTTPNAWPSSSSACRHPGRRTVTCSTTPSSCSAATWPTAICTTPIRVPSR